MIKLIVIVIAGLYFSACSTVKPIDNHRQGFFDRLSKLDSANYNKFRAPGSASDDIDEYQGVTYDIDPKVKAVTANWVWPVGSVRVTSPFGPRGNRFHEGVDLKAREGTPVYSVQNGLVIYAGRKISGYGNMVIIRHASGLSTVYAHNSKLLAKKGTRVKKGQMIALSGKSGRAKGPHLHFEVRMGLNAVDPLLLLPSFQARYAAAKKKNRARSQLASAN